MTSTRDASSSEEVTTTTVTADTGRGEFAHLFQPLKVGRLQLRNRTVSTAHSTHFAEEGLPSERMVHYHAERAKGGIGLIVLEAMRVLPNSFPGLDTIAGWDPGIIPGLIRVTDAVKSHGARVFGQVVHQGGQVGSAGMRPVLPLWAPSPVPSARYGETPHEMTMAEIDEVVEAHARSAQYAVDGGCDGVEIHAGHGYLPQQFLSPYTNRRSDDYGGALDNRLRFLLEIIQAVRRQVGPAVVVGVRISGDEFTQGGLDLPAMQEVAVRLVRLGQIDYLSVTHGNYQSAASYSTTTPDMHFPQAAFVHIAAGIKQVVGELPVCAVGRIVDPAIAERILASGQADLIAMTRAHIADPELANKARDGRVDEIRACIGCNQGCVAMAHTGKPISCLVNPTVGLEAKWGVDEFRPVSDPKRVIIVGGGPAGMEAARVAALRGHAVTLFERQKELGGQINLASLPPGRGEFAKLTNYLVRQLELLNVEIHLSCEVDGKTVLAWRPDAVIIATGSRPGVPNTLGDGTSDRPQFGTVVEVLSGKMRVGPRVVLLDHDGHYKAAATSEWLADQGIAVFHVTPLSSLGPNIPAINLYGVNKRLRERNVEIWISTGVRRMQDGRVTLFDVYSGRESTLTDIATVVVAAPGEAEDKLYRELAASGVDCYVVGDAAAPRRAFEAMHDGHRVGRLI